MKKLLVIFFLHSAYSFSMEYENSVNDMRYFADAYEQFKVHLLETSLPIYDAITNTESFQAFLASIKEEEKLKIVKEALSKTLIRVAPKQLGISNLEVTSKNYIIDSKNIILEYSDSGLMLFDEQTLRIEIAKEYTGKITAAELSPDGKYIAIASDKAIMIFNATIDNVVTSFNGQLLIQSAPSEKVIMFWWNPYANQLVSGSEDGHVKIWDLDSRKCIGVYKEMLLPIYDIITRTKSFQAFLSNAKIAPDDVSAVHKALSLNWYTQLGISESALKEAILPQIEKVNKARGEEKVKIAKEALSKTLARIVPKKIGISNVGVNRKHYIIDSMTIILEYSDTTLRLLDNQIPIIEAHNHINPITAAELSSDGKYLAVASNNMVTILNARTAEVVNGLKGYSEPVTTLAWDYQSKQLATGCHDGSVLIYNLDSGNCIKSWSTPHFSIDSMSWSFDGECVAGASKDNKALRFFDCYGQQRTLSIDQKFRSQSMVFWHNKKPYFLFYMPIYEKFYEDSSAGELFIYDIIEKKQVPKWEYVQFIGSEPRLIADSVTLDTEYGIFTFYDNFLNLEEYIFTEYALFTALSAVEPHAKNQVTNSESGVRIFWQRDEYITINNNSIKIIDKKTDQANYVFEAESAISTHAICGNKLIVAEENKKVHILDITARSTEIEKTSHPILSIATPTTLIRCFKNKDQDYIAIRSDYDVVTIYNMHGELQHTINHGEFIYELLSEYDTSSDEVRLLVASRNDIAFWTLNERLSLKNNIHIESSAIIKSESSGYWIIDQGTVTKLPSHETKLEKPFKALSSPIVCLTENPSGDIAVADERGFVHIYDKTGSLQHEFKAHTLPIVSMRWLNSFTVITSSQDNTAKIWISGMLIETINELTRGVNAISNINIYDQWSIDKLWQPKEIKFESLPGSYGFSKS